jgi:hypothetical protein
MLFASPCTEYINTLGTANNSSTAYTITVPFQWTSKQWLQSKFMLCDWWPFQVPDISTNISSVTLPIASKHRVRITHLNRHACRIPTWKVKKNCSTKFRTVQFQLENYSNNIFFNQQYQYWTKENWIKMSEGKHCCYIWTVPLEMLYASFRADGS